MSGAEGHNVILYSANYYACKLVGYIYLFSWHVIGIFNSLWFVIDIFNCLWSVNRQLTVNCDCIVLFTVNCDCLSENPVNCDLNITRDTWFRLLSVKYLGVAEIYIPRIAQNVPIVMIFFTNFPGSMPPYTPPLRLAHLQGLIHHRSPPLQKAMLRSATCLISCKLICQSRGVRGRSRVNELLNEWNNQGDEQIKKNLIYLLV